MSGKKIAEVSTPVSTVQGEGDGAIGSPGLANTVVDPETGQVAVGVIAAGSVTVKRIDLTVFADPKTQKSTIIPGMDPAAVHNGVVAGAKGTQSDNSTDGTILVVDGASGKVTKQLPLKQAVLQPLADTAKHAYFYGMRYIDYGQGTKAEAIFAVDLSTGALVQVALPDKDNASYDCIADQATSVVCSSSGRSSVSTTRPPSGAGASRLSPAAASCLT